MLNDLLHSCEVEVEVADGGAPIAGDVILEGMMATTREEASVASVASHFKHVPTARRHRPVWLELQRKHGANHLDKNDQSMHSI